MLSSYLWLFQSCRNNQMRRPSHNMFEMHWGGCNYFARPCCITRVINSSLPEIHCATGFKWQRREFGWEARDRSQGWKSGRDSVKETTEEQQGGAGLLTWDGTVLHGCARVYKHESYLWLCRAPTVKSQLRAQPCDQATSPWAHLVSFWIYSSRCDVDVLFLQGWTRKPGYPCHR